MALVYHYCNVDAFLSIIQKCIFWLSDIKKSNDPREGRLLIGSIFDYCNSRYVEGEHLARTINLIQEYDCEMRLYNDFYVYALCLSEEGDLLSQWRGYTQNAAGVSIGIDEAVLNKWNYSFENRIVAKYCKVEYGEDEKKAKQRCEKLYSLAQNINYGFPPEDRDRLNIPFYKYLESLLIQSYAKKEKSYSEEKEKRILYMEYYHYDERNGYQYMDYSSAECVNRCVPHFSISGPKYRIWKSGYKRYFELDFSKVRNRLVKEIILGPECELSEAYVRDLLAREKYQIAGNNKINIRRSEIAYSAR